MMAPLGIKLALAAVALLTSADGAFGNLNSKIGVDSRGSIETRTDSQGNNSQAHSWRDISCWDIFRDNSTASEHWKVADAESSWQDALANWKHIDRAKGMSFLQSVANTLGVLGNFEYSGIPNCGRAGVGGGQCPEAACPEADSVSGASMIIWTAIRRVHVLFSYVPEVMIGVWGQGMKESFSIYKSIYKVKTGGPDPTWTSFLVDLSTAGTATVLGDYFGAQLGSMDYYSRDEATLYNIHDTVAAILKFYLSTSEEYLSSTDNNNLFTPKNGSFVDFANQSVDAWQDITSEALRRLFDGSQDSIELLSVLLADGQFFSWPGIDRIDNINRPAEASLLSFLYPAYWRASSTYAFIMDRGCDCPCPGGPGLYVNEAAKLVSSACVDGREYYLLANGAHHKFSAPWGVNSMNKYGSAIQVEDFIRGSLRTYAANGNRNGGKGFLDFHNDTDSLGKLTAWDLHAPGAIRLPVCSDLEAQRGWENHKPGSTPNYPCDP